MKKTCTRDRGRAEEGAIPVCFEGHIGLCLGCCVPILHYHINPGKRGVHRHFLVNISGSADFGICLIYSPAAVAQKQR